MSLLRVAGAEAGGTPIVLVQQDGLFELGSDLEFFTEQNPYPDYMYDYTFCFMDHYLNFRTWDYQTNVASTSYPELAKISDFLAVTYFPDT